MALSTVVVYVGGYLFLVLFAVCLATGLYYIAELVEEHTRITKRLISLVIKVVIGIHVVLFIVDGLPILAVGTGIASHALYHQLLRTFPYITINSHEFLGSLGMLVASHVVWIRFFFSRAHVSLEWALGFLLIMLWLVPFAFFISLAANESVLPGAGVGSLGSAHTSRSDDALIGGSKRSRSTLLGIFNFLRQKRDDILPQVAASVPSISRRMEKSA